jgi:ribosomal-protein-alanine N-acetyltransferase
MTAAPPAAGLIRAGPAHAPAMAAIHAAAFPPAERWDAAAIGTTLALPGVLGLLDPAGGMALARLAADECELLTLAVLPARQRRGLGRRLLAAVMARAAAHAAAAMFLEVKASNAGALALYRRAGFAPVGLRRQYYADGADAWVLRAPLQATPCG